MKAETIIGIDLDFRPSSYFWARDLGIGLISDIKGAERRRMYQDSLSAQGVDRYQKLLSERALSKENRDSIGRVHPAFMGGEYLPDTGRTEVEVARIVIASTTQDVTSVYARKSGGRLHYRVVDEYDGDTLEGIRNRTSNAPLTLKSLVDFFLGAWDLIAVLEMNFADDNYPQDEVENFIASAESAFYPQFEGLIRCRVDDWLRTVRREIEVDD